MRPRRGLLRRWEFALGLLLLLAVGAWSRPRLERMTWRTRRAEAEFVLTSLAAHQAAGWREQGVFRPIAEIPRSAKSIGRDAVPWGALPPGWTPPIPVARCAYASTGTGDGYVLIATCDVDGDGEPSRFTVRPGQATTRATPEDVY